MSQRSSYKAVCNAFYTSDIFSYLTESAAFHRVVRFQNYRTLAIFSVYTTTCYEGWVAFLNSNQHRINFFSFAFDNQLRFIMIALCNSNLNPLYLQ